MPLKRPYSGPLESLGKDGIGQERRRWGRGQRLVEFGPVIAFTGAGLDLDEPAYELLIASRSNKGCLDHIDDVLASAKYQPLAATSLV
jgi:hypothetical protein